MKKVLALFIPLLVAALIFGIFQFISSSESAFSALMITSQPSAEVFLDNVSLGKTTFSGDKITPGEHTVKLIPVGSSGLFNFEQKIRFEKGVMTVVDRTFRSTEAESEGSIISLEKLSQKNAVEIAVTSAPDASEVKLDEQPQGVTPLLLKNVTASDHVITLSKDGYNNKTLRLRPTEGFRLTATVKLSIKLIGEASISAEKVASQSAQIRILDTPTGFLRVRKEAATTSEEIAKVLPGETYPMLENKANWYKIKLNGKEGWVSSQYATPEGKLR
ncbi:PEGA domain-containing protein [Candidatus Microgenomates bacterium]|nr:PEGA domain-containing protein [Candidatus Microgenomates bacterium]